MVGSASRWAPPGCKGSPTVLNEGQFRRQRRDRLAPTRPSDQLRLKPELPSVLDVEFEDENPTTERVRALLQELASIPGIEVASAHDADANHQWGTEANTTIRLHSESVGELEGIRRGTAILQRRLMMLRAGGIAQVPRLRLQLDYGDPGAGQLELELVFERDLLTSEVAHFLAEGLEAAAIEAEASAMTLDAETAEMVMTITYNPMEHEEEVLWLAAELSLHDSEDPLVPQVKVGRVQFALVPTWAHTEDFIAFCDQDEALYGAAVEVWDPDRKGYRAEFEVFGGDMMYVQWVEIEPAFRGRDLGLRAIKSLIDRMSRSCGICTLHAGDVGMTTAQRRHLERYFHRLGFMALKNHVMWLDCDQELEISPRRAAGAARSRKPRAASAR